MRGGLCKLETCINYDFPGGLAAVIYRITHYSRYERGRVIRVGTNGYFEGKMRKDELCFEGVINRGFQGIRDFQHFWKKM